ncbi:hypothetical protein MTO96_010899 [Rhipicephalus appendiculatus]
MDKGLVLSLLFWSRMSAIGQETSACASYRQKRPTHTTCSAASEDFTITSGEVELRIDDILTAHNRLRSQLAMGQLADFPPAANMVELRWDREMSDVALALARQGTNGTEDARHDLEEDRFTYGFLRTGQNVLTDRSRNWMPAAKWPEVVMTWFDQNLHYDVAKGTPSSDRKSLVVYVCNYGPAGNELNASIYLEGPACSHCPRNTRCNRATGLCVLPQGEWALDLAVPGEPSPANLLPTVSTTAASGATPTFSALTAATATIVAVAIARDRTGALGMTTDKCVYSEDVYLAPGRCGFDGGHPSARM